jgi:integrase
MDPSSLVDFTKYRIISNPVREVASLSKFSKPRTRTLTKQELARLWHLLEEAVNKDSDLHVADRFIRANLLLGGQRCQQLARVKTSNVNTQTWTITLFDPKGRRQTPRVHEVPISTYARPDIEWLLAFARDTGSEYLFPGRVDSGEPIAPDSVVSRVQRLSDQLQIGYKIPPFAYSDLRRTTQTHMAALKIPEEVANRILSHGLGGVVARHYNFHQYESEMREALEAFGKFVTTLRTDA